MARTVLVTGSASGIGKATVGRLRAAGQRVFGADLREADIEVDLGTADGREHLVREAERLAPDGLDAVLAGAGISRMDQPARMLSVNYFGAVATLEGLRPLLAKSPRPRAVAICSTAALLPTKADAVRACLDGDEALAGERMAALGGGYAESKQALSLWLRRAAVSERWAGAGILLNGVAPGVVETAMTAPLLQSEEMLALIAKSNPMAVKGYAGPDEIAELIAFLLGFENHYLLGQIIFIDGGTDALMRPDQL